MGYPTALTAKTWGFYDVSFKGQPFKFQRPYGSYVMENVLFKISFPAEFHAQTAVEAAITLHSQLAARGLTAADIKRVTIRTHEACIRIIDKQGPLNNPADRDHCIQYMTAVGLIFGRLTAEDYDDAVALDPVWGPRIDAVRASPASKTPPSPPATTTPRAAPSPTHSPSNSPTEPHCPKLSSSFPSATVCAAPKASLCCSKNSSATSHASHRMLKKRSLRSQPTKPRSKPYPSMSSSTSSSFRSRLLDPEPYALDPLTSHPPLQS